MAKVTRRMRQIIKIMQENGAHIQESRDAFLEKSSYSVEWKSADDLEHSIDIKKQTLDKLIEAGLVEITENNPVYRRGKFVTSEGVYELTRLPARLEAGTGANKSFSEGG